MFDVLKIRNTCIIYEPQCVRERKREKKDFYYETRINTDGGI